uniref:non-specific serine/threonine protein kinase n=1 Tax=Caenorhabditis tropicalis TaxID=1561998 RepID=A0A1I7TC27_9PELO
MKTGYILLSDNIFVKLADIGSAFVVNPAHTFVGTALFMALDVILAMDEADHNVKSQVTIKTTAVNPPIEPRLEQEIASDENDIRIVPVKDLHMPNQEVEERIATLQNHKSAFLTSFQSIQSSGEDGLLVSTNTQGAAPGDHVHGRERTRTTNEHAPRTSNKAAQNDQRSGVTASQRALSDEEEATGDAAQSGIRKMNRAILARSDFAGIIINLGNWGKKTKSKDSLNRSQYKQSFIKHTFTFIYSKHTFTFIY